MSAAIAEKLSQEAGALRNQGQTAEAKAKYEEAERLFKEAGDEIKATDCQLLVATCLHMEGNLEESVRIARSAANKFAQLGAKDLEGAAYVNVGSAYFNDDQFDKAAEWFKKALVILKDVDPLVGHGYYYGIAHTKLGSVYVKEGRFDEAKHELVILITKLAPRGRAIGRTARLHAIKNDGNFPFVNSNTL